MTSLHYTGKTARGTHGVRSEVLEEVGETVEENESGNRVGLKSFVSESHARELEKRGQDSLATSKPYETAL